MTIDEISAPGEAPPPAAPWRMGAGRAWLIFTAYLGVQLVAGFVVGMGVAIMYIARHGVPRTGMPPEVRHLLAFAGGAAAVALGGVVVYALTKRAARREPGLFRAIGWTGATPRMRIAAALLGLAIGMAVLLMFAMFPPPPDFQGGRIAAALREGGWMLLAWSVLAVAIAPPVEELLFRGVMWTGLSRSWNPWLAAIVVTLVFVALHLPDTVGYPLALAGIGAMGLTALAMRVLSGSIVPPMFLHAAYNAMIVAAVVTGQAAR
jgi:membrane protease YdiL (CAAX protease family)